MFVQYFIYVKYSEVLNTFITIVIAFHFSADFKFPVVVWAEMATFSKE